MSAAKPWCVQHRKGWCMTKDGAAPDTDALKDRTACGYVVIMRIRSKRREPTCPECKAERKKEVTT